MQPFETALVVGSWSKELAAFNVIADEIASTAATKVVIDHEALPFAQNSFDLALSFLNLHTINDIPGTLRQFRYLLRPGGVFLASFIGEASLKELRHCFYEAASEISEGAAAHFIPSLTVQQTGQLLQRAGFTFPVVDLERKTLNFQQLEELIHWLRDANFTNILTQRNQRPLARKFWQKIKALYQHYYHSSQGLPATIEVIYATALKELT